MSIQVGDKDLLRQLSDNLPANCRRVVIDITIEEFVKVYYECFGDEAVIEIARAGLERGIQIRAKDIVRGKAK